MTSLVVAGTFLLAVTIAVAPPARSQSKTVSVDIKNAEGRSVGTATLSGAAKGVKIKLDIRDLPPGQHSIHIHQVAKCDPPDFKSAGRNNPGGGQERRAGVARFTQPQGRNHRAGQPGAEHGTDPG